MTNWPLAAILAALACWLGVLGMRGERRWPKLPKRDEPAPDTRNWSASYMNSLRQRN